MQGEAAAEAMERGADDAFRHGRSGVVSLPRIRDMFRERRSGDR